MTDLIQRIEAAGPGEQRALLQDAYSALFPAPQGPQFEGAGEYGAWLYRKHDFATLLDAEAYVDAALMLVPEGWWLEFKGPRRYLNIPTPVPNYWSANIETWNHEGQKMGWASTPALAIASASLKAGGHQQ